MSIELLDVKNYDGLREIVNEDGNVIVVMPEELDGQDFKSFPLESNERSKPIPGLKPGAFGLLHAWFTGFVCRNEFLLP